MLCFIVEIVLKEQTLLHVPIMASCNSKIEELRGRV